MFGSSLRTQQSVEMITRNDSNSTLHNRGRRKRLTGRAAREKGAFLPDKGKDDVSFEVEGEKIKHTDFVFFQNKVQESFGNAPHHLCFIIGDEITFPLIPITSEIGHLALRSDSKSTYCLSNKPCCINYHTFSE